MLEGFLVLAAASDSEITAYAQEWGLLDLCQHHLPREHPWTEGLPTCMALTNIGPFLVEDDCRQLRWESIETWRYWAGQARAIVNLGLRLARGSSRNPDDVARLYDRAPWVWDGDEATPRVIKPYADTLDFAYWEDLRLGRMAASASLSTAELQGIVEDMLGFWLDMTRVTLRLRWFKGHPDMYFTNARGEGSLFAALGLQLLLAVTRRKGYAFCSYCGAAHVPARPNDPRASFCETCRRDKVPQRLAAQRYRATKRMAK